MLIIVGWMATVFCLIEKNEFSLAVWFIEVGLTLVGVLITFGLTVWGIIPLAIGVVFMKKGLMGPKSTDEDEESKAKKVWLITFLGKPTDVVIEGLSLLLPEFLDDIMGHIEFNTAQMDKNFLIEEKDKPIIGLDGVAVTGKVSVSIRPDYTDDPEDMPNRRSAAQKLQDLANVLGIKGVQGQLDDLIPTWIQDMYGNRYDSIWIERNGVAIARGIAEKIQRGEFQSGTRGTDIDDTVGFGIEITKLQVLLKSPKPVMDARNQKAVEMAQREFQILETETIDMQIKQRMDTFGIPYDQAREAVLEDNLERDGNLRGIRNRGPGTVISVDDNSKGGNK